MQGDQETKKLFPFIINEFSKLQSKSQVANALGMGFNLIPQTKIDLGKNDGLATDDSDYIKESYHVSKQYPTLKDEFMRTGQAEITKKVEDAEKPKDEPKFLNLLAKKFKNVDEQDPEKIYDSKTSLFNPKQVKEFEFQKYIMQKVKQERDKTNQDEGIDNTQKILVMYQKIYQQKFGKIIFKTPNYIATNPLYNKIDPIDLAFNIKQLEIDSSEPNLYWVARFYMFLPLYGNWTESYSEKDCQMIFYNEFYDVRLNVHPSFFYVKTQIMYLRNSSAKDNIINITPYQNFVDKFNRVVSVDVQQLLTHIEHNTKIYDVSLQPIKQDAMLRTITKKLLKIPGFQFDDSKKLNVETIAEKLIHEAKQKKSNDLVFMIVVKQQGVDINANPHELCPVGEFLMDESDDNRKLWEFRNLSDGYHFWVNRREKKSVWEYPFQKDLKKYMTENMKKLERQMNKAPNNRDLKAVLWFSEFENEETLKDMCQEEKIMYMNKVVKFHQYNATIDKVQSQANKKVLFDKHEIKSKQKVLKDIEKKRQQYTKEKKIDNCLKEKNTLNGHNINDYVTDDSDTLQKKNQNTEFSDSSDQLLEGMYSEKSSNEVYQNKRKTVDEIKLDMAAVRDDLF